MPRDLYLALEEEAKQIEYSEREYFETDSDVYSEETDLKIDMFQEGRLFV